MTTVLRATDADVGRTASDVDPLPDLSAHGSSPSTCWLYPPGQYALARLHRLVADGFAVNRHVDYAQNFGALEPVVRFRRRLGNEQGERPALERVEQVVAPAGEPAVLAVAATEADGWECSTDDRIWEPVEVRLGASDRPPHREDEPTVLLDAVRDGDLWVLPVPVLGRPVIRSTDRPEVVTGESPDEARAPASEQESRHIVVRRADGAWTTQHQHGFRWLRVTGADASGVQVEAAAHPVARRGSFRCSDPALNQIWSVAAFTLRTCMHGLMVDGIKRDRMPWIGDQALTTLANAYAFADGDVVRDSLDALGRVREGYVNGIADYSLWWLVTLGMYARHFDAGDFLAREGRRIDAFVQRLAAEADVHGVLRPVLGDGPIDTVFIDWDASIEQHRDSTALQLLWYWALRTTARLLGSVPGMGPSAERWDRLAGTLLRTLREQAWDEAAQAWRTYLDDEPGAVSPYPQLLAVLAEADHVVPTGVEQALLDVDAVGTPFMGTFALLSLAHAGHAEEAVRRVRVRWGAMLQTGARTFWEQHGDDDDSPYAMYGRPFGRSLCHAWSAGPAALLPQVVCGIRPVADAWARVVVEPELGELTWADAIVPVPQGTLAVRVGTEEVSVDLPAGITLVHGDHEHAGPVVVRWSPAEGCHGA